MIVLKDTIKVEYETIEEREKYKLELKEEGFQLLNEYTSVDFNGREHILAEFVKIQKGYIGRSIYK